jgi:hypothetical protein
MSNSMRGLCLTVVVFALLGHVAQHVAAQWPHPGQCKLFLGCQVFVLIVVVALCLVTWPNTWQHSGGIQWWNSERFVVITRQLQAAKCSLSWQLFRHVVNLLDFDTVAFNVNKRLLDLSALHLAQVSSIFC